jgi:hypothetical protein
MKRITPYILIFAITAILGSCDKPTEEQKKADALFQKITKVYTLNPDGSMDYHYQHELDLHTHYAFNRLYGETFIVYNPEHQELTINRSETETAEGKMVPSPDNAFNEVLPRFASGAPPYHQLREMVVTHTGLEKNSTIYVDYNIHSEAGYQPFLMENTVLAESSPVRELVIKVRFPQAKELNYKLLNAEENLNISNKDDMKEYKWVFEDLQATSKEDHQPAFHEHLPRLIFSTANFNKTTSYFMDQFSYELPVSIGEGVKEALKGKKNKMDSVLAIREMVVNHVNHFDIPLEHKGYTLHSNEQVLENNGGTTFEKTVLLTSILRKTGFEARPVAIIPDSFHSEELGNLECFEKYFVELQHEGQPVYLSAINDNGFNKLYGQTGEVHVRFHDTQKKAEAEKIEKAISTKHLKGTFSMPDIQNIQGEMTATLSHCENPCLAVEKDEQAAKSILSPGFPASSMKGYEIQSMTPEKSRIHYTIEQKLSPDQQNGYRFISIPQTRTGLDHSHLDRLTAEREAPFEIGWPIELRYQYTIELPESVELVTETTSLEKSGKIGKVSINIENADGKVSIDRHLKINKQIISPEVYPSFREMVTLWKKDNYRTLTFKEAEEE